MGAFLLAAAEAATALGTGGDFPSGSLHLSHWEGCDFPVGASQIPLGNPTRSFRPASGTFKSRLEKRVGAWGERLVVGRVAARAARRPSPSPLGGASGRRATTVRAPLPVGYLPIKKCNKRLFSFYFSCFPNWFSFSFPTIPTLHVVFLINTYGLKDKIRLTFAPKNIDRHTHRGPRPERARAQQVTRLLDSKTAQSLHGTGRAGWAVGPVPRPPSGWRRCGRARLTASSGWCAAARGVAPPAA